MNGDRKHVQIIAELGINHNGDLHQAIAMIHAAADAGADIIKFHTYRTESVMLPETPLADYMKKGEKKEENFFSMAKRFELSLEVTKILRDECIKKGVTFLSSPFDEQSVYDLQGLGVGALKIPSGETVNPLLLEAAARTGLPLIVSTGMCDVEEIEWAVSFLQQHHSGPITLLQCTSQYPAEFHLLNLRVIPFLRDHFQLPVGFSDHSPGIEAAIAAVALGAECIEKHFTLDRSLPGPDQQASLEPQEFASMVRAIRHIEVALGDGIKKPTEPELVNRKIVRKSLVTLTPVRKGELLSASNLGVRRPGTGIPARYYYQYLGRPVKRDLPAYSILLDDDVL